MVDRLTDANPGSGGEGSGLAGDLRYCLGQVADGDAVTFAVTGSINLTAALPSLAHDVRIDGPGAALLTIRGQRTSIGGFSVRVGSTVSISGLTVAESDGGIGNSGTLTISNCTVSGNWYGAVYNRGTLTLDNSTVSNNAGSDVFESAIFNYDRATMTIANSTISDNFSIGGDIATKGGGIRNAGIMAITNSTISGNRASYGGGIFNGALDYFGGSSLTVSNCTISGNTAGYQDGNEGGGICNEYGGLEIQNTILAGNYSTSGGDITSFWGPPRSAGHNLVGDSSGYFLFDPTDLLDVDPRLGPLQDNGGPTLTMALLPGSPALNAGEPDESVVADQRGVVRTGGVNIGAYQASSSAFVLTAPASVTAGTPFDLTVRAKDSFGQPAVGYTGTAHLSSSDGQAVLPDDHTFTLTDGGSHTFPGVALRTAGISTVTATDAGSLTGSGTVTVRPAAADHILLTGPASASAGIPFDLTVTIQDAYGNRVTDYAGTVTFSTDDPDGSVPADYTFTTDDAGTHTFVGGVTLYTNGSRVTVTDTQVDTLTGSIIVPLG
jgi:hypothetical protein